MKKIIVISLIASASLFAFDMENIHGEIIVGGGIGKSNDNLSTYGTNNKDFNKNKANAAIMGSIEISDFELSLGQESLVKVLYNVNNDISVYAGYDSGETWENPFIAKNSRKTTDVTNIYGGINYKALDWLELGYNLENQKIKSETVHANDKRSGNIHTLLATVPHELSNDILVLNTLEYNLGKFDGKNNDYNAFGINSELQWQVLENTNIKTGISYKQYFFDNKMNYFNKKRDEKTYGVSFGITQEKLFGYKNLLGYASVNYDNHESNINFYDTKSTITVIGLGYRF